MNFSISNKVGIIVIFCSNLNLITCPCLLCCQTTDCGHLALIESLGSENLALNVDNEELRERVEGLYRELSIKEAQWCESEEKYKLKVSNPTHTHLSMCEVPEVRSFYLSQYTSVIHNHCI